MLTHNLWVAFQIMQSQQALAVPVDQVMQLGGELLTMRMADRYLSGSDRKALASWGAFSSRPSNSDRAKVRQWSML